jgi:serine/threonine-protein kinase
MSAKLEEGAVFAARYRVIRCIAAGGMGAVYEVLHLETNRRRALKVMHPHLFESDEMRSRFKLEARIAAEVDSEYIVDVFDAGVDEATQMPFLVMELLRGEELGDRLKRLGGLPHDEVVTYMQQTAWALDRTHAASIVHRDLKPQNLFLTTREDGTPRIKILDFGVAKLIAEGSTAAGATRSLGTPLYMAPEQFRANFKLTAAADIHALTLMTYTLLVGKAYWAEEAKSMGDVIAFAMVVVNGPQESAVQRAARRGVTLPPGFDAWFAKGTAVNPAERFTSATEAVRALRAVSDATGSGVAPITATPTVVPEAVIPLPESRPAIPSVATLEQAETSTGASAVTTAMAKRSRGPFVAGATAFGLAVLGVGAWLTLRPATSSPTNSPASSMMSTTLAERSTAPAAISAAPVASSAAPTVTSAAPAVKAATSPEVAFTAIPPSAAPTAPTSAITPPKKPAGPVSTAPAVTVAKTPPPPAPVEAPPLPKNKLLGPD